MTAYSFAAATALVACAYKNSSERVQIARMAGTNGPLLERAVFPGQSFQFEAAPEAHLEIYSGETANALLEDRLSCRRLAVIAQTPAIPIVS